MPGPRGSAIVDLLVSHAVVISGGMLATLGLRGTQPQTFPSLMFTITGCGLKFITSNMPANSRSSCRKP